MPPEMVVCLPALVPHRTSGKPTSRVVQCTFISLQAYGTWSLGACLQRIVSLDVSAHWELSSHTCDSQPQPGCRRHKQARHVSLRQPGM